MKILVVDLGKKKRVACLYESESSRHRFRTLPAVPGEVAVESQLAGERIGTIQGTHEPSKDRAPLVPAGASG